MVSDTTTYMLEITLCVTNHVWPFQVQYFTCTVLKDGKFYIETCVFCSSWRKQSTKSVKSEPFFHNDSSQVDLTYVVCYTQVHVCL